ncbi:NADPH-dependent assimilatory sulfite reductase hemoprotein subunit [Isosphaeraceae bacterium EP7]
MDPNRGGKPTKVEAIKIASQYLRVHMEQEARNGLPQFTEDATSILKFHGSYQQDDRDQRTQRKREGLDKAYSVMIRVRIPGGKIHSAAQYLAIDELASTVGNGTLRITTRQEFQLHGVLKRDLASTIKIVNETLFSTLAACGDVNRNVLCCPAPIRDGVRDQMQADVDALAVHFAPRSSSYVDLWLDGEPIKNPLLPEQGPKKIATAGDDSVEPLYGAAYLPRKFKVAFALPDDNCTDIYANDLGYLAIVEDGKIVGYDVLTGGGLGTTPSADKTFPALAHHLGFIPREDVLKVGEAILKVFRDLGNRADRKRARLKYIIYDLGLPAFRAKVEEYLGRPLEDPRNVVVTKVDDHLGWHEQGDGKLFLGIPVENGRIKDAGSLRLASGLRAYFQKYGTPARLTCQQSIILSEVEPSKKAEIESLLEEYGIAKVEDVSNVRRWSMACPALPTCGLAVTEAERALPALIDELEAELKRLDLQDEVFTVRMTGCPNGCARPYNSDIGLVGRSAVKNADGTPGAGTYTIFLGGRTEGDRLNVEFRDYIPYGQVVSELTPVLTRFKAEHLPGEALGDFCHRIGVDQLVPAEVAELA